MSITNIFKPISDLWTYYDYYRKARRIQSDWERIKAEWIRIGGFDASIKELIDFLATMSVYLVEYATWTPIEWDDAIAVSVRMVLTDYRNIVVQLIDWTKQGKEPSTRDIELMAGQIGVFGKDAAASPMTILAILSMIFQALQYLKTHDTLPPPNTDGTPTVEPPKRPVINFIRGIFNR